MTKICTEALQPCKIWHVSPKLAGGWVNFLAKSYFVSTVILKAHIIVYITVLKNLLFSHFFFAGLWALAVTKPSWESKQIYLGKGLCCHIQGIGASRVVATGFSRDCLVLNKGSYYVTNRVVIKGPVVKLLKLRCSRFRLHHPNNGFGLFYLQPVMILISGHTPFLDSSLNYLWWEWYCKFAYQQNKISLKHI